MRRLRHALGTKRSSVYVVMPVGAAQPRASLPRGAVVVLCAVVVLLLLLAVAVPLLVVLLRRCEPTVGHNGTLADDAAGFRLPLALIPRNYWLSLHVYLPSTHVNFDERRRFTFDGNVTILIHCHERTDRLVLHAHRLSLSNDSFRLVDNDNQRQITINEFSFNTDKQQVVFELAEFLSPGASYTLKLSYRGELADDLAGFYRSSYTENGETKWLAVSQFQPTAARRALPCFDEPHLKASFMISIIHPRNMVALSNTREEGSRALPGGWTVTDYSASPNMSTYLLAMVVCEFESRESQTARGTRFRIWARPSLVNQTAFAASVGPQILTYFEDYFQLAFPLDKQDMVAIPDFDAGAMENWGLITYRDIFLLHSDTSSSAKLRQRVVEVVTHELAHQWFGNLVTMAWWNDLWLNEGFATYLQYQGSEHVMDGAFKMLDQFATRSTQMAMARDQLATTHALQVPIKNPEEIFQIFDHITYDKGAAVVRMLQYVVGERILKASLRSYLKRNVYSVATMSDLWNIMTELVRKEGNVTDWDGKSLNVSSLMHCWVVQKGMPLISLARNYSDQTVTLTQARYTVPETTELEWAEGCAGGWTVPVWLGGRRPAGAARLVWLRPSAGAVVVALAERAADWLLANAHVRTFGRANYDARNWLLLGRQLKRDASAVDVNSKSQLLDDAFSLAQCVINHFGLLLSGTYRFSSGRLDYDIALELCEYLKFESEYPPWETGVKSLNSLSYLLIRHPQFWRFTDFCVELMEPLYERLGMEARGEAPNNILVHKHRWLAWKYSCKLRLRMCVDNATNLFRGVQNSCRNERTSGLCNTVSPNLRDAVYCTGVSEGRHAEWDFVWDKFSMEHVAAERWALLQGLSCSRDLPTIHRLLDKVIAATEIRLSETGLVFEHLASNPLAKDLLWPFVHDNWDALVGRYGDTSSLAMMVRAATRSFSTTAELQVLEEFVERNAGNLATTESAFRGQVEKTRANVVWFDSYSDAVIQWLRQRRLTAASST